MTVTKSKKTKYVILVDLDIENVSDDPGIQLEGNLCEFSVLHVK